MHFLPARQRLRASRFLVVIAFALTALPLYAASSDTTLTLKAATQIAARRAPQVQARLLRTQAARHDAVRAGRLPDLKLTAGISNLPATGPHAFSAAADMMTMRTIGLMQVIPSSAERDAEKAVARANVRLAGANTVQMRLAVKRAAADAWVTLWAAERERKLLEDLRDQSALAVNMAKAKLTGGTGNATDVLAARVAVVQLDNRLTTVNADIVAARAALRRWVGDAATNALASAPDFATLPVAPTALRHDLNRQGPLLGWTAREEQAQAQLALAKAGKHPDWSVSVMYGRRIGRPDMIGLQVGVSLPIFPGNRQDQDISARYAERAAVEASHEAARRAQRQALASRLATWRGDTKRVQRYRRQLLPLAADRAHTALALYRGGGALQPWLDARQAEITTRMGYATTLAAWGKAWVRLAYLMPRHNAAPADPTQERLP